MTKRAITGVTSRDINRFGAWMFVTGAVAGFLIGCVIGALLW